MINDEKIKCKICGDKFKDEVMFALHHQLMHDPNMSVVVNTGENMIEISLVAQKEESK